VATNEFVGGTNFLGALRRHAHHVLGDAARDELVRVIFAHALAVGALQLAVGGVAADTDGRVGVLQRAPCMPRSSPLCRPGVVEPPLRVQHAQQQLELAGTDPQQRGDVCQGAALDRRQLGIRLRQRDEEHQHGLAQLHVGATRGDEPRDAVPDVEIRRGAALEQLDGAAAPAGIQAHHGRSIAYSLGLEGDQVKKCVKLIMGLYDAFTSTDMSMLEINPLVVTGAGDLICLDAKVNFDSNALYRHPDMQELRDLTEEDAAEIEASKYDLS